MNAEVVAACTSPYQTFLDFEVSVRHGKSMLVSGFTPAWYLGLFPDRRVILLAYNEDKAAEWGEFTREVMVEWGPSLFGVSVDPRSASKTLWSIKGRRGELLAAGMDGTITGKGGDLVVIDDPVKNRSEADSPTMRAKMVSSYYSNVRTRLPDHGTVILAMARWHESDLAGEIVHGESVHIEEGVEEEVDDWKVIRFPAIAEAPRGEDPDTWRDELGRKEGDALWPEKFPVRTLERTRATIMRDDPQTWHSLYQQNPTAKEGKQFKVDKWVYTPHVDREGLRMVRFWDLAATDSRKSDWTVGLLLGMDPDNVSYVLDVQRFRANPGDLEDKIRTVAQIDGTSIPIRLEQERAGAGKLVTAQFVRLLTGWDVDGTRPQGDKTLRARPVAAQQNKGRVVLFGAPWNAEFVEECRVFDNGRHDDQVDALSGAFEYLAGIGPTTIEIDAQRNTPLAQMYGQAQQRTTLPGMEAISRRRAALRG